MRNPTTLTVGLLTVLVALGTFDALLIENKKLLIQLQQPEPPQEVAVVANSGSSSAAQSSASSVGGGIRKIEEPNVLEILTVEQFNFADPARERSLLEQIIPSGVATVQAKVLVKDGDRIGLIAWADSPQVKIYLLALKEALHSTFSPEMRDLVDEAQEREGKALRNLLTFLDPAINEERVVFIRIRERLYEFHVAEGKDAVVFDLIETLTN
ncbi:MAG: hypothetical protein UY85_C0001G0026 [Candidatus Peribacteria bacterium GW2011_GWB1_54_5]|nr:MAG: hypothetical protein UY85_C0001G0026 [Candidatus Peribacteria bacterium GW2011_GWB1_54_5]